MKRASVASVAKELSRKGFCGYESVLVKLLERRPVPKVGQFLFLGQEVF